MLSQFLAPLKRRDDPEKYLKVPLGRPRPGQNGDDMDLSLRERIPQRTLPLVATFAITALASYVATLQISGYRNTTWLYQWALDDRTTLSVAVYISALVLGSLWTFSMCALINFESRAYLTTHPISLDTLRLWSALSTGRVDWNLPIYRGLLSLAYFGLLAVPSIIWTAALTAQFSTTDFGATIAVPLNGNDSYTFLGFEGFQCSTMIQANGTFSTCPNHQYVGSMLLSAASATTADGQARNHSKYDNTKFRYKGRSYGVGSSVGLTDTDLTAQPGVGLYYYMEDGLLSNTSCIYNSSALWRVTPWENGTGPAMPNFFLANGFFPNSNWTKILSGDSKDEFESINSTKDLDFSGIDGSDYFAQVAFGDGAGIVSLSGKVGASRPADDPEQEYFAAIAVGGGNSSGGTYGQLDRIQCKIAYSPTTFFVNVSTIDGTIEVRPRGAPGAVVDPKNLLRGQVTSDLTGMSMVPTSLYTSVLGDALLDNIRNTQIARNQDPHSVAAAMTTAQADKATVLAAVAASVDAVLDDLLMAYGSASLVFPNSTAGADVTVVRAAVQLGDRRYAVGLVLINALAFVLALLAALRSRLWRRLPRFNYADLASMAAAVALGNGQGGGGGGNGNGNGYGVAEDSAYEGGGGGDAAWKTSTGSRAVDRWSGDPRDSLLRRVDARYKVLPLTNQPSLVLH